MVWTPPLSPSLSLSLSPATLTHFTIFCCGRHLPPFLSHSRCLSSATLTHFTLFCWVYSLCVSIFSHVNRHSSDTYTTPISLSFSRSLSFSMYLSLSLSLSISLSVSLSLSPSSISFPPSLSLPHPLPYPVLFSVPFYVPSVNKSDVTLSRKLLTVAASSQCSDSVTWCDTV